MQAEFLNLSGRYALLTKNEEIQLGRRIQKWLTWEGECPPAVERSGRRARDRFVLCNMRLVTKIAKSYTRRILGTSLTFEDLLQEGALGLQRAAEKYDPECGWAYSTYATWWIRQAMSRAVNSKGRTIRVSEGARRKLKLFRDAHQPGDTVQQTLERAGLRERDCEFIQQANLCERVVAMDAFESPDYI
jgi:RNA polymerase primary sigma factor